MKWAVCTRSANCRSANHSRGPAKRRRTSGNTSGTNFTSLASPSRSARMATANPLSKSIATKARPAQHAAALAPQRFEPFGDMLHRFPVKDAHPKRLQRLGNLLQDRCWETLPAAGPYIRPGKPR